MNNKNKLKKVIENDYDISNNYSNINKKISFKKCTFFKMLLIPTCFIFVFIIIQKGYNKEYQVKVSNYSFPDLIFINNDINYFVDYDIDGKGIENNNIISEFNLENIKIPNNFTLYRSLEVHYKDDIDDTEYNSKKVDYSLIYIDQNILKNNIYSVIEICFSPSGYPTIGSIPAWDIDFYKESAKMSIINGNEIYIIGNESNFYAFFTYDNISYTIDGNNINKDEFIELLKSIVQ